MTLDKLKENIKWETDRLTKACPVSKNHPSKIKKNGKTKMISDLNEFEFSSIEEAMKYAIEHSKQYHIPRIFSYCRREIKETALIRLNEHIRDKKITLILKDINQGLEQLIKTELDEEKHRILTEDKNLTTVSKEELIKTPTELKADSRTLATAKMAIQFVELIIDDEYDLSLIPEEHKEEILSNALCFMRIRLLDNQIRWTGQDIIDQLHYLVGCEILFCLEKMAKRKEGNTV